MSDHQPCALLGQLLLANGEIEPEILDEALDRQKGDSRPLGQILLDMGAVDEQQLERALRAQARLRGRPESDRPFILVVDSDPEVGALAFSVLESAGYRVGIAHNEVEVTAALMSAGALGISLIILDLGILKHGGVEFVASLSQSEPIRSIPVVILNGTPEHESEIAAVGLKISGAVVKPVTARQLVDVVEAALPTAPAKIPT